MSDDRSEIAEVLGLMALLIERSSDSIHQDIDQVRNVVSDAIQKLGTSFDGLRAQTRKQERILLSLIDNLGASDEDEDRLETDRSHGFGRFVEEINDTLRFFVDQMLSVSTESMTMVHHVDDLSGNMDDVVAMLKHVDGIVSKTNFLALNAHIEAARAGEAGRAFKIVADEVRGLSRESSHFSKEIRRVVEESKHGIEDARLKVGEIASQDMTHALSSQTRVREMLRDVSKLNTKIGDTLSTVQEITEGVARSVGAAVRALQFEDIVIQLLNESDNRLGLLNCLREDLGHVIQQHNTGQSDAGMQWFRARLISMHESIDSSNAKVTQSSVDEGSIELF